MLGPAGVSASPMLGKKVIELLMQSGLSLSLRRILTQGLGGGVYSHECAKDYNPRHCQEDDRCND